ncbi:MAG: rhomboid family intramembrane serine protease [Bacteroidia bacterium]|nr:rhomboid family intramembrane serine protease [Bacteroidia bacterium]
MTESKPLQVIWTGIRIPLIIVILWFTIHYTDEVLAFNLNQYGLIPLRFKGLAGIVTAPLLHADYRHIWSNAVPFILLGGGLFILYKPIAIKILMFAWVITGLWTWFFARGESVHIGASGVVYALAAFHLAGALVRRRYDLAAFALIVVFFYGSLVWGFFPEFFPDRNISWESHLMGAVTGTILALFFRKQGPKDNIRSARDLPDEETSLPWDAYDVEGKKKKNTDTLLTQQPVTIQYSYTTETKPRKEEPHSAPEKSGRHQDFDRNTNRL